MRSWVPLDADQPAANGTLGRWLTEAADLVATDADARVAMWSADRLPTSFPRDWPAAFKSEPLRRLLNKSLLKGTRCRAVPPATAAEREAVGDLTLHPMHAFANAERVASATGWSIVKGFLVLERSDAPVSASFIAIRHWWNVNQAGSWVDLTPPLQTLASADAAVDGRRLLVESTLGEKAATPLTPSGKAFACALAARLAAGQLPETAAPVVTASTEKVSFAAPKESDPAPVSASTAKEPGLEAPRMNTASLHGLPAHQTPSKTIDYAKWDALDVSDDDEQEAERQRNAKVAQQMASQRRQDEEIAAALKAQQDSVTTAVDAAIVAATNGNLDVVDEMSSAARAAAPLPADLEALVSSLPLAAQIAARAAATNTMGIGDTGDGKDEKSLKDIMASLNIGSEADDPGLEGCKRLFWR